MVEERLLEANPPSDRVPGRGVPALPILEARRRRNRGEIAKRVLSSEESCHGEYIGKGGQPGGQPGVQAATWPSFGVLESSDTLIFYLISPDFWSTFNMGET